VQRNKEHDAELIGIHETEICLGIGDALARQRLKKP